MLEGCQELWRDCGAHVFKGEYRFGGEAVLGDVGVDGGAEICAVDEEVEGDGFFGVEEVVHYLRETETLETAANCD